MENDSNATPAGDSAPEAMSLHAAAGLLGDWEETPETPVEQTDENPSEPAEPTSEAEPEEAAEEGEIPTEAEPAEEAEPEPNDADDEYVHGNKKTRLRDGTVTTVAELKKAADEAKEYRAREAQFVTRERELAEQAQRYAQQEQLLKQTLPLAQQVLQAKLPQPPDPKLATEDPIEHYQQMVRYQAEMQDFKQLQAANQARAAQAQHQQVEAQKKYLGEQRQRLLEARPELADPAKVSVFYNDFLKVAADMGFSKAEVDNVHDHRLMHGMMKLSEKARKWDALQAQKPRVAEKAKTAIPVAAPGKRASPQEVDVRAYEERIQRVRSRGGRLEDAAALLADY